MEKVFVICKKTNVEGVAQVGERVLITLVNGIEKDVAESTFKRWYKKVDAQEASVEAHAVMEGLLEVEEELQMELEMEEEEQVKEVEVEEVKEEKKVVQNLAESVPVNKAKMFKTRGGKTKKIVSNLEFNNVNLLITEYDGYVCDVEVINPNTLEVLYKSPKMSIKDTLENGLGMAGDKMKEAHRRLIQLRKAAKQAI